ncbi:MAG: guanylate kinase [Bacteroidetes bacterium]|nr:MAG: guanylate kinase [Bacteroidota bacterium]TNE98110.1 MAG: guanylate kinase [Bacteroidota bacterium]
MDSKKGGKCVIFSAPSGAGKTTIVHRLLAMDLGLEFSVSACSRGPRPNEVDGKDYHFLGIEGFKQKIKEGAFVEWEEVYRDNFYGTLRSEIERIWSEGKAVIFDVDVVGGLNLKKQFQDNALAIFVQPPSYEELEKRLRFRSTETEEKINQRMEKANKELSFAKEFDYILINDDLEKAVEKAKELVVEFLKK